jgi:hypothetical protein
MVTDIIGGQVDFGVVAVNAAQQHIQSGALRAVAAMGGSRIASCRICPPEEQGFTDAEVGGWFAAIAPGKMPAAEVKKLQAGIAAAFAAPEVKEAMAKQQNVINPTTPEAAAQFFKPNRRATPGWSRRPTSSWTEDYEMADLFENPMGLMGFEFVEFASPTPDLLEPLFEKMGFSLVAKHRSKDVLLFRQGDINFIVNREPNSEAAYFAAEHGPSACGLAFRVKDSHKAYARALELGAHPIEIPRGPMELRLPAIKGIGGAPLYLIDRFEEGKSIYDIDFEFLAGRRAPSQRPWPEGRGPPDSQRLPRPHGALGRFLREAVQLPRDPLLRHSRASTRA